MLSITMFALTPECARCSTAAARAAPTWCLTIFDPCDKKPRVYGGSLVLNLMEAARARRGVRKEALRVYTLCACDVEGTCHRVDLAYCGELIVVFGACDYVAIPADQIERWFDEWTPFWRMARMRTIGPAERPADEGV